MSTLWHGRFSATPADTLLSFTQSLSFDRRLAPDDIECSRAHVRGLVRVGLLHPSEGEAIDSALTQAEAELASGDFTFVPTDEDIHTAIERRVTELAGDVGAKLHTGRSRNDQVATDLRLYLKRETLTILRQVHSLQSTLLAAARSQGNAYLPGYTHVQRAQPVLLAHHLSAHCWALARDVQRLLNAREMLDVCPLGAGALAGSSLPLAPDDVASDLGFARRFDNSLDAVSDRDFVADVLYALTLLGLHLSRIGEEFVLWSTDEFGFVRLDDAYSTGSSMLPQKKNPDIAELARAKSARLVGNLTTMLVALKGLPLSYNRDLQEDKEALFDSIDQICLALPAVEGMIATATFDIQRMQAGADAPTSVATDLAEWLVTRGVAFRAAHAIVGSIVRRHLHDGTPMEQLVSSSPDFDDTALSMFAPGQSVRRRTTPGGAGPGPVAKQLDDLEALLVRNDELIKNL